MGNFLRLDVPFEKIGLLCSSFIETAKQNDKDVDRFNNGLKSGDLRKDNREALLHKIAEERELIKNYQSQILFILSIPATWEGVDEKVKSTVQFLLNKFESGITLGDIATFCHAFINFLKSERENAQA